MKNLSASLLLGLTSVLLLGALSGCPPKKDEHEHKPGDGHDHDEDKEKEKKK